KFFSKWIEKFNSDKEEAEYKSKLKEIKNKPLSQKQTDELFADRFKYVRNYFDELGKAEIQPTVQDEYLYNLCRPERLMDLSFNYILFEDNIKKITRYQQFFAIKKSMQRIKNVEHG